MSKSKRERVSGWKGFYSYRLNDSEKAGIRDVVGRYKTSRMAERIVELVDHRFKVSVAFNDSSAAYVASITGKEGNPNAGYTYSISHMDLEMAVCAVWFVASEVNQWGEWDVDSNEWLDW